MYMYNKYYHDNVARIAPSSLFFLVKNEQQNTFSGLNTKMGKYIAKEKLFC